MSSGESPASETPKEEAAPAEPTARQRFRSEKRERALHKRALHNLEAAVREAGSELSPVWVAKADPDLEYFRTTKDETFAEIVDRLRQDPIDQVKREPRRLPLAVRERKPVQLPVRPWGDPLTRFRRWRAAAAAYLVLLVVAAVLLWRWTLWFGFALGLSLAPLILALSRLHIARKEQRVDWEARPQAPPRWRARRPRAQPAVDADGADGPAPR